MESISIHGHIYAKQLVLTGNDRSQAILEYPLVTIDQLGFRIPDNLP